MPVITVSAVNTSTDTLTATAHGLTTGDRFRLRNVGGALPAATPALAAVTDYFAVKTGTDTLKAATSSANALAATPVVVDLTGSGSGTTTVEYGLPYCVPRIAAPLTQVFSADFNADWNSMISLYGLLTGQAQSIWSAITLAVAVTFNALATFAAGATAAANQHFTVSGTGEYKHGDLTLALVASATATVQSGTVSISNDGSINYTAATVVLYGVPLTQGDRIKSVVFAATGNNTVDGDAQVFIVHSGGASATNIGTTNLTNVSSTKHDETVDVTDTQLGAGDAVLLLIETTAAGLTVGNIRVVYDRP